MVVRAAALSAGLGMPWRLFPDHFEVPDTEKEEAEAIARGDDVEYDYSGLDWEMPSESGDDPEEVLRLMSEMGANLNLSVNDDDSWKPEPMPEIAEVLSVDEEDREWL